MRIISFNANGVRSAARKGFFHWMDKQNADIVCLQETKVQTHQLEDPIYWPKGYRCYYLDAVKKGYSGVALYSRREPDEIVQGLGWPDLDAEGRYLEARFGSLSVVSLYLPSGSSSEERQAVKFDFMNRFLPYLRECAQSGRTYIFVATGTSPTNRSTSRIGAPTRRIPDFCLRNVPGWISCSSRMAGSMLFVSSIRSRSNILGGRIAVRPGPRTWAGVSTTR